MTDPYTPASTGWRAPKAAWLALIAAAALYPAFPAHAEEESGGAAATDASAEESTEEGQPGNTVVRPESNEPEADASAMAVDVPLYGPPSPKVERGKLAQVDWEAAPEHFPPALEEAIQIVTKNYPSAMSARAALRAAASDVRAAKWLRFPSISGNLSYLDSSGSPEPQVIVETPIWSGGRIGSNIRRAKASEDASSAEYVETIQSLALTTSNTYFEIVRLTQAEQLLAESVELHQRLVETMERRVKQEVSPVADLELARSRAAQIEQQFTVTRSQRHTALRVLAELIADPAYDIGPVPYYNPELDLADRASLEEQAVAYDPISRRLRAEADVARADMESRRASIFPQLNAQYSYDDIFHSRVGVVVRAQTTGGLSQFSEVNAARLRIQSALENVRLQEQQLRRDIASDIIQYEAAKRRAVISRDASDTAARVSESYMRQFIAGRRSWLDVMNALREAVSAQLGRVDSEVTAMATATRLLLLSGRWQPAFDNPDVMDPKPQDRRSPERMGPRRPN